MEMTKDKFLQLRSENDMWEIIWQYFLIVTKKGFKIPKEMLVDKIMFICTEQSRTPNTLLIAATQYFDNLFQITYISKDGILLLAGNREDFFITNIPEPKTEYYDFTI